MIVNKRIHLLCLLSVVVLVVSTFLTQPAPVSAQQDWHHFSADVDGDGLPNEVEDNGWYNGSGGPYVTDYLDADSDDDGLTDGQEKLYDTDPFNDHSPGIYAEYQDQFKTKQYYPWQRFGSRYSALPVSGQDEVVVRRGTTFSVGGPAQGQIEIGKSIDSLDDLTVEQNSCSGRWDISVPADGTVGIYTLRISDGDWSESLNLYVIFELPTGVSSAFTRAFVYDDDSDSSRDTTSIGYWEGGDDSGGSGWREMEYTHEDYPWIPAGEWITHGYTWGFKTQHFDTHVFKDHVMPSINGKRNTWDAANALGERVDEVTCTFWPNPLGNSWCVLNPTSCYPYEPYNQCTNVANLLTAFNRAAGIASRPIWTDWVHTTFDHSTEVWTIKPSGGSWDWYVTRGYVTRGYAQAEDEPSGGCPGPGYEGGYKPLRNTSGWYSGSTSQGVYAADENWSSFGGSTTTADKFRMASWDLNKAGRTGKIIKKSWFETRYVDYWGWPSEPQVTGSPPQAWPSLPPPPVAEFVGSHLSGTAPLAVMFSDLSSGHVSNWSWNFGDDGTSTEQNPIHTYTAAGDYTVSLTVRGAGGLDTETKINYIHVEDGLANSSVPGVTASDQKGLGVALTSEPSVVEFGQVVADYGVDLDGDGRYDQLVFEIQVKALQAGDYWIRGVLGGDYQVPVGGSSIESRGQVHLSEGLHTVQLPFDGMDIYMSKADGPYILEALWMTDVENPGNSDFMERELAYAEQGYQTAAYRYSDFGQVGATLSGVYNPYVVDSDGNGLADALVVDTGLNVEAPGSYTVQGVLYDGREEVVSQASWSGPGPQVSLRFEGLRDTEGPYHVHVRNEADEVTDGMSEPYELGELPELNATPVSLGVETVVQAEIGATFVITDGYSDTRVDTDGDGQYDQLVMMTTVEVEPGEGGQAYRIEGWLVDENDNLISWARSDAQVLSEGVHALSLAFDGHIIRERGLDGPYTLMALKALPGDTYSVLSEVDVAYTTPAYGHDEFDEPGHLLSDVAFEDDMEHGSDQWGANGSWSLGDRVWYSANHAWETDDSGNLTTIAVDLSDHMDATLRFRTCYAMQSGADAGHVEVSTDGSQWTELATYTNSTSEWVTQFLDLSDYSQAPTVQLRFSANANSQGGLQWYVDDVYISGLADLDEDGVFDEDLNGDGDPTNDDSDGDGTPNYLDPDDDGDGISTRDEGPTSDQDGDHVPDYLEPNDVDTDQDGTNNHLDDDDDGDGVPTAEEDWDHDGNPADDDSNGDGVPDYLDPDVSEPPVQPIYLPLLIK
jgi:PKD repeat protein